MFWVVLLVFYSVLVVEAVFELRLGLIPGLSVKNAFFYAILLALAMHHAVTKRNPFEGYGTIHAYLLLFIGWAAFTLAASVTLTDVAGADTIGRVIRLKSTALDYYLIFAVFLLGVSGRDAGLRLAKLMLLVIAVSNGITLVDVLGIVNATDTSLVHSEEGRIGGGGALSNPNGYATFLVFFIPQMLAMALVSRRMMKFAFLLGGVVLSILLVMTASRAGLLGLMAGTLLGSMLLSRTAMKRTIGAMAGIYVLAVPAAFLILDAQFIDMLLSRVLFEESATLNQASSGRLRVWSEALRMLMEHPYTLITGYGWDAFGDVNGLFKGLSIHSVFMNYLFNLGLVGLLLYAGAILMILRTARCALGDDAEWTSTLMGGFIMGLIGFHVCLLFSESFGPQFLVWPYVGLTMRLVGKTGADRPVAEAPSARAVPVGPGLPYRKMPP